jgi:hypothetical protein
MVDGIKGLFLMEGSELDFWYRLFVPYILEVLGQLLFTFEQFVVYDGVNVLNVFHFFYIYLEIRNMQKAFFR